MKEIYDAMKPSEEYTAGLDEKLPVNRVPSRIKRKYAREAQYVKTFPKTLSSKKCWYKTQIRRRWRERLLIDKQKSGKEAPVDI